MLAQALESGYVIASTDCGHSASREDGRGGADPAGHVTSRDIYEMTADGKAVTTAFYGIGPAAT